LTAEPAARQDALSARAGHAFLASFLGAAVVVAFGRERAAVDFGTAEG
jgi:hypothetical protein